MSCYWHDNVSSCMQVAHVITVASFVPQVSCHIVCSESNWRERN